jgi:predicted phosphodiesterase
LGIACLRGNHDVVEGPALAPPQVNAWCRTQLDAEGRAFLESLPASIALELPSGDRLLCVHGSPRSHDDEVLASTPGTDLDAWVDGRAFEVMASGHTHQQLLRRHRGRTYLNPGSVAQPFFEPARGGKPPIVLKHAEYAVIAAGPGGFSVDFRKVAYDFDAYARDVRASGLPDPEQWLSTWAAA